MFLPDSEIADTPEGRGLRVNHRQVFMLRRSENAHPLITWVKGPNAKIKAGRTDQKRSQWVKVNTFGHGIAERVITPAQAEQMFTATVPE